MLEFHFGLNQRPPMLTDEQLAAAGQEEGDWTLEAMQLAAPLAAEWMNSWGGE